MRANIDTIRVAIVRTPYRAPTANAVAERWIGSVRRECLDHLLIVSEAHLRQVLGVYLAVRPRVSDDHLFVGQRGRGLSEAAVWYLVTKYARQAGLEDVSPHTLRHSFGKQLLDATKDLVAVAALLGHEKLETTAVYTQPSARDLERAVALLEREGVSDR